MQQRRSISDESTAAEQGFRSRCWEYSYRSSSISKDDKPDDLLHDFYIPALSLAKTYDRVAGYFRSSSLAAASQGFSGFVGRDGKMRLIVGADLDPDDVRAVLAGDQERLSRRLGERLEAKEAWPEDVRRGVTLLAWMVANGYLELRVAFRVHAETREPIPFDAGDDGYFHEKWFVMTDAFGDSICGSGSLNESKTALVHNFENVTVFCSWRGGRDLLETERLQRDFEVLWNDEAPHLAVKRLPDAVRERLIRIADGVTVPIEIDGTRPATSAASTPSPLERLRFFVLRDAPKMPGGRFVGLSTAPVEAWPHQEVVVRRLVQTWPYSYLLCDEVGLGKTIEAGLAFRCLYLSGIARRILIAAPASLTEQWLRQMASKVLMHFGKAVASPKMQHEYIFPKKARVDADSLFEPDLVIISTGLLARSERAEGLRWSEPFDIVLLDEAHAARRSNPTQGTEAYPEYVELYRNLRDIVRPAARSLWLATATPMQLHPVEVCDLISLTNSVGAFQYSPRLTLEYYAILGKLVDDQTLSPSEWSFLRHSVKSIRREDQFLWEYLEKCAIPASFKWVFNQWLEEGRLPYGRDLEILRRILFSVAPLSRVMMRHTRGLLDIYRKEGQLKQNLARRSIEPLRSITFSEAEKRIYDQLEDYCKGLNAQVSGSSNSRSRNMMQFFLSFLRLRFASSLYAIEQTLRRRLVRVEATLAHQISEESGIEDRELTLEAWLEGADETDAGDVNTLLKDRSIEDLEWESKKLNSMLQDLEQLRASRSRPTKMRELLRILDQRKQDGRIKQTVIFTRFYDTLVDIVKHLRVVDSAMRIGTYSGQGAQISDPQTGQMRLIDREQVKALFLRGEIDVLICTDAAAEGLNLQTADMIINFDLGWNPMKIEQRIGRIDRIGQWHDVIYVVNLCYAGSIEEKVYGRLLERLKSANLVVGTQPISLLPVTPEDFLALAEGTPDEDELAIMAEERIRKQQENARCMELPPQDLYDIYRRMKKDDQLQPPIDRDSIWEALTESEYLRELGCEVVGDRKPVFSVKGIKGIPGGVRFTVSPDLYESGLSDWEGRLHFASYGDPYFDVLLDHMTQYELPPCIRRMQVSFRFDSRLEMVAYAVACRTPSGETVIRSIWSWDDLKDLTINESAVIDDQAIQRLEEQLHRRALEEYRPHLSVQRIEDKNVQRARLEQLLELSIIKELIEVRGSILGEGAGLNSVFKEIEALYEDRETLQASIPADPFRDRDEDLLFKVRMMTLSDRASVSVPPLLARASLDRAKALVASMKVRGGTVQVSTLLNRLERDISRLTEDLQQAG